MISRIVLVLASALLLSFASTPSDALTFDFSFSNVVGDVNGTVTGQIFGLTDNTSNQAATLVDVTSAPAGLGLPIPPNLSFQPQFANPNSFTVTSGTITNAAFDGSSGAVSTITGGPVTPDLELFSGPPFGPAAVLLINTFSPRVDAGPNPPTFTEEAPNVPLPATLPLFATGLGALGLLGWRRKRKARVSLLGAA